MSEYICCIEMGPTTHSVWVFVRLCISIWNRGERLMFYQCLFPFSNPLTKWLFFVFTWLANCTIEFIASCDANDKNDDNVNEATTLSCQRRRQMCENICLCVWKSQIFRWKCGRIFFSPSTNPVYPVLCLSHFISSSFEINIPNHGASLLGMLMHVCMLIFICLLWLPQLTIQFTLGHTPNNMELHRMNLYISVYRREFDRRDRKRERKREREKKECEIAEIGIAESEIHTFHRKIASMYVSESQTQTSTALCLIFEWYSRVAHRKLDVLYR